MDTNRKNLVARPPERKKYRCDVLVIGGGFPGVCAAIPADISLTWEKEIRAKEAHITFDTLERTWT